MSGQLSNLVSEVLTNAKGYKTQQEREHGGQDTTVMFIQQSINDTTT